MKNKKTKSAGIVRNLRHRIRVIESLEIGKLYEVLVCNPGLGTQGFKLLIQVDNYDDKEIMYRHLASEEPEILKTNEKISTFFEEYDNIRKIKRVMPEELPLYIGWGFKTERFSEILRGDNTEYVDE